MGFTWCAYSSREALSLTTDLAICSGHVVSISLDQPLIWTQDPFSILQFGYFFKKNLFQGFRVGKNVILTLFSPHSILHRALWPSSAWTNDGSTLFWPNLEWAWTKWFIFKINGKLFFFRALAKISGLFFFFKSFYSVFIPPSPKGSGWCCRYCLCDWI